MSQERYLKIPQLNDRTVMSKFSELISKFGAHYTSASLATVSEIAQRAEKDSSGKYLDPWDTVYELNGSLIQAYHVRAKAITIVYYRRGRDRSSPIYDEIGILYNPSIGMDVNEGLEVVAWVERAFKAFDPKRSITSEPHNSELAALHESTLTRLEGVAQKVIEDTAVAYSKLEHEYLGKREHLENQFDTIKAELESEHKDRMAGFESKEAELAARKASIDDRDNTHARRATRNAMLQDVKERILNFGVSSNTSHKRKNVASGLFVLLGVLLLLLVWSMVEANQLHELRALTLRASTGASAVASAVASTAVWDKTDLYFVWARISLLTVGVLFSILYYIKWENRWADQHASAEFQLQQFYVDVNRANWVVESGLEWHKETGSTIPDTIMQSLTTNLFKHQDEAPQPLHPADELASALLGSASKLRLKAGDSELEFDKPGKIKEKT